MNRWELITWCVFAGVGAPLIARSWPKSLGTFGAPGLVAKQLEEADSIPRRYVLYIPREYNGTRPFPLIVFLHGSADFGVDGRLQLKTGLGPEVWMNNQSEKPFPYFVLFPQAQTSWSSDDPTDRVDVIRILDITLNEFLIDTKKIYLTGISMGAEGVFELAAEYPERWAAIVPISCDGSWAKKIHQTKHLPIRWYQNKSERIEEVRHAIAELKNSGWTAELIEYDNLTHDAWTKAYADSSLYVWLSHLIRSSQDESLRRND